MSTKVRMRTATTTGIRIGRPQLINGPRHLDREAMCLGSPERVVNDMAPQSGTSGGVVSARATPQSCRRRGQSGHTNHQPAEGAD